jgi:hypothetical protein
LTPGSAEGYTVTGRPWYQWLRISFALLTVAAIVGQLSASWDRDTFSLANFFSFFTIQSNILAALILLVGAWAGFRKLETLPAWELIHGAAVAYMTTTFIVFAALLSGLPDDLDLTEPWVNFVLHQLIPVVILLDWLISPPYHRLTVRRALVWAVYPIAYCAYSLIRGPIVDWYPYPFLNPDEAGGYLGVVAYAIGIAVLFVGIIWFVVTLGNKARDWWSVRSGTPQLAS